MNAPISHQSAPSLERIEMGALDRSLGFVLRMAQITAFETLFRNAPSTMPRPGEFSVLWMIGLNPGIKQGLLAQRLRIKPAHMTKLTHRLFLAGYVQRELAAKDRRSICLRLTDRGAALVAEHRALFLNPLDGEELGLTASEAAQLLSLLQKIAFERSPHAVEP